MREEYIEYRKDMPINISLCSIKEYPLHWKDSLDILFVLQGSIDVTIEMETYCLGQGDIEIVNRNEIYSIESKDESNLVLIMEIDQSFFDKYYDGVKDIFFYTNSLEGVVQEGEKYFELRKLIAIISYEIYSKLDDYKDIVEKNLVNLIFHLLNNFHYLFYEEESLREDEVELGRYHRIIQYINKNYMNKVSLQELADMEYLSSQYLSYKIKDTFGQSFNDFLNKIRVEESRKLLLNTEKSISEISQDVGFSHIRYYNKHFKTRYSCLPADYRKRYKLKKEEYEALKSFTKYPIEESIEYLQEYLVDYERFEYDNKIIKKYIDLDSEPVGYFKRPDTIDLGDVSLFLEEENRRILEKMQDEIGFKYCIIKNLFSDDMDIYRGKNNRFINWTRVENILDFLYRLKLSPIIYTDKVDQYIREDFISTFSLIYGNEVEDWLDFNQDNLSLLYLEENIDNKYDTLSMLPYIIDNYLHKENRLVFNIIDEITKETELFNDTFFGGSGIITSNGLSKPSYYVFMILSLLGEEILYKEEGYILTRSSKGYQILLYNPSEIDLAGNRKVRNLKFSLNLLNMKEDYLITKYKINKEFGSVYNKWLELGSPERISTEYWDLLEEFVHPNISFFYSKKSNVYNIIYNIKSYGAVLYVLDKVQS